MANQKKLFLNLTPQDEAMLMEYQVKKMKKGETKPTYVEILDEAGVNMEKLRVFLKSMLQDK